jgi:hypothetical protein
MLLINMVGIRNTLLMDKLKEKIDAKVKRHNRLKNDPRVRSVLAFLVHKGFLISNETFGDVKGVPGVRDFLFVAKHFEPRVYTALPALLIHFKNSIGDISTVPKKLQEITHAIEKGQDLDLSFGGIHYREMKFMAELPLSDKRVKPLGEKKIVKTFRLSPKVVAKLEQIALKESKKMTEVIEELIERESTSCLTD